MIISTDAEHLTNFNIPLTIKNSQQSGYRGNVFNLQKAKYEQLYSYIILINGKLKKAATYSTQLISKPEKFDKKK